VPIIFALIGIYYLYFKKNKIEFMRNSNIIENRRKNDRNKLKKSSKIINNKNFLVFFLIVLFVFSVIVSLDPTMNIFGREIKFPSYYLFKLIPIFRVYTRFYPFILMSLIVIASIGMSKILEKIFQLCIRTI